MPRVRPLTKEERWKTNFYNFIFAQNAVLGIKQSDIADTLGVSQPAVVYKLKNRTLTISEFCDIVGNLYDMDISEALAMISDK